MAYLELLNVSKTFGRNTLAVKDFDLQIEKGELVSFLGPSGCGKTTTLRMVAGFEMPTEGTILMGGENITNKPANQRNVGMVFQAYALFPNMTVGENIGFGLKVNKQPPDEIKKRVDEMLELINMGGYAERYPYQLSGGQQQRVALARALAIRPQVLLLDEPLSALDAKIRVSLRSEIRSIQQRLGITAIYVTHDQEEALSMSDRVVVMHNGIIEQVGQPFEIYNFPQTEFVAQFVGTLNTIYARVVDAAGGRLSLEGQEIQAARGLENARDGETLMIALRPERLEFTTEKDDVNTLECRILNITFLGSIVRIQLQLGEHSIYMDTFNQPHLALPKIGEKVTIKYDPEAILVMNHKAG